MYVVRPGVHEREKTNHIRQGHDTSDPSSDLHCPCLERVRLLACRRSSSQPDRDETTSSLCIRRRHYGAFDHLVANSDVGIDVDRSR